MPRPPIPESLHSPLLRSSTRPWLRIGLLLAMSSAPLFGAARPAQDAPPSRALMLELCREPRLAGTAGSERAAHWVAGKLTELGWRVELESRDVLLSYATSIDLRATIPLTNGYGLLDLFHRRDRFDPDLRPTGDVPLYHAWAKSGLMAGVVVDCGRGLRADFERLVAEGVDLKGAVALCRYGGAYRGVKVALAAEFGCHAALLYDHGDENGPGMGEVWPKGPWKPPHEAQRGSILSLTDAPGDPTTPGWASPLVSSGIDERDLVLTDSSGGTNEAPDQKPLSGEALAARLPKIPSAPIGWAHAKLLLDQLEAGPTPVVHFDLDMRVERRTIVNVIASLGPVEGDFVMAGTHRDAWVRGAQDSGSGIVSLLRAAEHLSARAKAGWAPKHGIKLAFWDGEETGLFGSTEYGEAHADELQSHCLAYLNGDACVSGLNLRASGTPGLLGTLSAVLRAQPALRPAQTEVGHEPSLYDEWSGRLEGPPRLGLVGSGSDYTVFLHHLGVPVLDFGFGGNPGGQYHTAFDDFAVMDRFLDPEWRGHEAAGALFAGLLEEVAARGRASFDEAEAASELARVFQAFEWTPDGAETPLSLEPLVAALEAVAQAAREGELRESPLPFYARLALPGGLPGRPWYRNPLWAPGRETGYAAVLLPTLRATEFPQAEIESLASHVRGLLAETAH